MIPRRLPVFAALLLTAAACGGGGSSGTALPAMTKYYSCDETYTMGGGPIHLCVEYSQTMEFATPSANSCTPTANGYMGKPGNGLSTTAHCPKAEPGCVCVSDDQAGHYEEYRYQSADQDAYKSATILCSTGGTVSCFGGLIPPADAGAP